MTDWISFNESCASCFEIFISFIRELYVTEHSGDFDFNVKMFLKVVDCVDARLIKLDFKFRPGIVRTWGRNGGFYAWQGCWFSL